MPSKPDKLSFAPNASGFDFSRELYLHFRKTADCISSVKLSIDKFQLIASWLVIFSSISAEEALHSSPWKPNGPKLPEVECTFDSCISDFFPSKPHLQLIYRAKYAILFIIDHTYDSSGCSISVFCKTTYLSQVFVSFDNNFSLGFRFT